ncbi:uncharacterized protein BJ171DRAFT_511328 [Polychytrium aggregatum]|uniref:uncharacterized protein n=1 Tax=Polychytrium aggregatum TaxID=110093 RepID=UPI0022FEF7EC|nr:uncharacterized protein BJ171DRAFT_511328 [Polychytrium aggregatum]KAI9202933.1 hypothetical protein BJ171DRAFT_511328 [Polychytrium aggregatum]
MRTAQPVGGTLDYMAPEMLDDENPAGTSKKTDVYAFAITIYEVFKNGQPIWVTRDGQPMRDRAIESQVTRGNRPARIDAIPDDIWSLVERCWRQDPGERPTFAEILAALDPYKNYTAAPPEARPNSEPAFSKAVSIQPNGAASKSSVPRIDRGWSSQSSQSSRFRPSPLLAALVADLEALPNIPRLLLQRARQGEIKSCFDIARLISEGKPATDPLWGTAARLYQVAADKDNLEAFFHLGWLHLTGIGTTQSDVDALTYWTEVSTKSTDAVHQPIATMMAGWLHHLGRGTRQDKRRAAELMRQSRSDKFTLGERIVSGSYAASCDSPAAVALFRLCQFGSPRDWLCEHIQAICHLRGFGTSKDEKQAVAILEKLANQGHDDSQHILGKCYGYGWGVASSSAHSFPWYSKAADQGNLYAQNMVGRCLQDGSGVPKDPLKAAEWLRKAAEQGNSDAQSNLGWCYQHGSGVAQDFTKAIDWYNRSVDQENRYGCYNLAYCFQNGIGVVKDNTRACELFKKSAELDYSLSQSNLAECLEKGLGVPKDIELAVFWYHKAAAQGNSQAKQRLQELGR